jgi:hypothetical protein
MTRARRPAPVRSSPGDGNGAAGDQPKEGVVDADFERSTESEGGAA